MQIYHFSNVNESVLCNKMLKSVIDCRNVDSKLTFEVQLFMVFGGVKTVYFFTNQFFLLLLTLYGEATGLVLPHCKRIYSKVDFCVQIIITKVRRIFNRCRKTKVKVH
jgi:hypothetical protein